MIGRARADVARMERVDVRAVELVRTAAGMEVRIGTYGRGWWGRILESAP